MTGLQIKSKQECRHDLVSLGEVMLRFDSGETPVHAARDFRVWEGGGEYNVARALRRTFHQRTSIVTALCDNAVGRLIEDLMLCGGVDLSHVRWTEFDGTGTEARNGVYFIDRGFGVRPAQATYDRGHTAISQLKPGDIDWAEIFTGEGARWFHTGGIFAGLSESCTEVAAEAMAAARAAGAIVSYDANYRALLWKRRGGEEGARRVNRDLAERADVIFGSEWDFVTPRLKSEQNEKVEEGGEREPESPDASLARLKEKLPNARVIATTVRRVLSASRNEWGAVLYADGVVHRSVVREIDVFDRVGGGDAFASGVIYGLLESRDARWAVECGAACGAHAQTTPGDALLASLAEIENLMHGGDARAVR